MTCRGGIIQVGTGSVPPTGSTGSADVGLLTGFTGRRDFWTFVYEGTQTIWVLQDLANYTEQPDSTITAPKFLRTSPTTTVARFYYSYAGSTPQWVEDSTLAKQYIPEASYSMVGRYESGVWTLYLTSRSKLYRYVPSTGSVTTVMSAGSGRLFRGVALPPWIGPTLSPSWSGTPSPSPQ